MATIALLVGALAYYFLTRYEYIKHENNIGFSAKALANPFLAAENYLNARGVNAKTSALLSSTDNLGATEVLFVSRSDLIRSEARIKRILAWVRSGGRLILGASYNTQWHYDGFLEALEVTVYNPEWQNYRRFYFAADRPIHHKTQEAKLWYHNWGWPTTELKPNSSGEQQAMYNSKHENHAVTLYSTAGNYTSALQTHLPNYRALWHQSIYNSSKNVFLPRQWVDVNDDPHIIYLTVGKGDVFVISSAKIWNNDNILYFDHAFLLQLLIEDKDNATFLYDGKAESFWQQMFEYFPEACILLALAICLLAWGKAVRVGPAIEQTENRHRDLSKHINASAALVWRVQPKALLQALRERLSRHLQRRHPYLHSMTAHESLQWLNERSSLAIDQLEQALYHDYQNLSAADFTQAAKTLALLRKSL